MADDILANYQHVIDTFTFITGTKGIFDVKVNGDMLYSKHQTGRHAEPGEVLTLFKDFVGPGVPTYSE